MKNIKKPILVAIALAIAGLMIASTAASTSMLHVEQNAISESQGTVGIPTELTSMDATVSIISIINCAEPVIRNPMKNMNMLSRGTDVLVFHDINEEDCQNPALVTDATLSNILVFTEIYEGIGQTGIWGRFSTDAGGTWGDEIYGWDEVSPIQGDYDDVSIPKLDYYGEESWAYGTCTAGGAYDAATYYFELPSIIDPNYDPNGYGWVYYSVNWPDVADFSDFDSADVGCFPYDEAVSPSSAFWGWIAGTGDRPPGEMAEDDTMWFSYFLLIGGADQVLIVSFYNMDEDVEKMATDIDMSIGQPYMVMEYTVEEDPLDTGSMFMKSPPLRPDDPDAEDYWWDGSFPGFIFDGVYNPDIVAADGSVYIVGERVDGDKDIVCLYSSDAGDSFQESPVTDTTDDETFPQIAIFGDNLVCSYTRNGNLYAKISSNGGVTWEDEEKVNDPEGTVIEQYGNAGIDGPYASWTDDRDSPPTEIYFDVTLEIGNPPGAPDIDGPTSGKVGTAYDYNFTAIDPDGDDVKYYIDWGDDETDETGFAASGTPVTVSHTWTKKGDYVITAKAEDIYGLVGPEGTLPISMPFNQQSNQQSSQQYQKSLFSRILGNTVHSQIFARLLGL